MSICICSEYPGVNNTSLQVSKADLIRETNRSMSTTRRMTKPPKKKPLTHNQANGSVASLENNQERSLSRGSTSSSLGLLSNVPYSHPTASNVFGIGSEHPFANYWTCQGGLAEVISVLPEKIQADILLERYFECVDPVCYTGQKFAISRKFELIIYRYIL
jgi:hypothetical protein